MTVSGAESLGFADQQEADENTTNTDWDCRFVKTRRTTLSCKHYPRPRTHAQWPHPESMANLSRPLCNITANPSVRSALTLHWNNLYEVDRLGFFCRS